MTTYFFLAVVWACTALAEGEKEVVVDKLPATKDVIAGLEAAEARIKNLEVTMQYTKVNAFTMRRPHASKISSHFIVDTEKGNRLACEESGDAVSSGKIVAGQRLWTFDGQRARHLYARQGEPFSIASIEKSPRPLCLNPWLYTTRHVTELISVQCRRMELSIVGEEEFHGRKVLVAETARDKEDPGVKVRFFIDPKRWVVMRRAVMLEGPKDSWHLFMYVDTWDYAEIEKDIWLPTRFYHAQLAHDPLTKLESIVWSFEGTSSDWKVNQKLADERFHLVFPDDVEIHDHTKPEIIRP